MANTIGMRHIRSFLTVARHRSFTRAALELNVTQPTLTMAIRQLEDIVGARLFDRTTRMVELTPEGHELRPLAERLLGDFDALVEDIRATARQRRGRVAIAAAHSVTTQLVPVVLADLARTDPSLHIQLRDGNSSDVRRRVSRNEVDFGIGSPSSDQSDLDSTFFFRDQLGLLITDDHAFARDPGRTTVGWDELHGEAFIGLSSDTATGPLLAGIPDLPESVRTPRYEVASYTALWALIEHGLAVTSIPALAAPQPGGRLRFLPLARPTVWRETHIIRRRGRILRPGAELVLEKLSVALEAWKKNPFIEIAGRTR